MASLPGSPNPSLRRRLDRGAARSSPPGPASGSTPRLAEIIASLALATDLGTGQPVGRGLRRCALAVHLAEALGFGDDELRDTYYLALLRYVGCTTDAHVIADVLGDEIAASDWFLAVAFAEPRDVMAAVVRHLGADAPLARRALRVLRALTGMPRLRGVIEAHCEVGQRLAERFGFGPGIQRGLTQIAERWDGAGVPEGLRGEAIMPAMRVVQVAQEADAFHAMGGVEAAVGILRRRSGRAHDPGIVERFCDQARRLFARIEEGSAWDLVLTAEPAPAWTLPEPGFDSALEAIADFTDLKSPYLGGHSRAVAALAEGAVRRVGLPERDALAVRRAALLHDIGRVAVSSGVWGKPGGLTEDEWERVRLHPYHTERVLSRSPLLSGLGELGSLHHERLDGSGYHRRVHAGSLSLTARILAAADVYQSLTEPRPHRPALVPAQAADALRDEARTGRLDGGAVDPVLAAAGHRVRARRALPRGLTAREVEVLRLVARGLSDREMAKRLMVSPATVHHHVQHIYAKLGVSTRAAATLFAMEHDLLADGAGDER